MAISKTNYYPDAMRSLSNQRRDINRQYRYMAEEAYRYGYEKFHDTEFSSSDFASATGLPTAAVASIMNKNPKVTRRRKEIVKNYVALDEDGRPNFMDTYQRRYKVTMWRFV